MSDGIKIEFIHCLLIDEMSIERLFLKNGRFES